MLSCQMVVSAQWFYSVDWYLCVFFHQLDAVDRVVFCLFRPVEVHCYSVWMCKYFPLSTDPLTDITSHADASCESDTALWCCFCRASVQLAASLPSRLSLWMKEVWWPSSDPTHCRQKWHLAIWQFFIIHPSGLKTQTDDLILSAVAFYPACIHTHTQPFYGSVEFVRENPGELVSEETFTHYSHHSHQSSLSAFSI